MLGHPMRRQLSPASTARCGAVASLVRFKGEQQRLVNTKGSAASQDRSFTLWQGCCGCKPAGSNGTGPTCQLQSVGQQDAEERPLAGGLGHVRLMSV